MTRQSFSKAVLYPIEVSELVGSCGVVAMVGDYDLTWTEWNVREKAFEVEIADPRQIAMSTAIIGGCRPPARIRIDNGPGREPMTCIITEDPDLTTSVMIVHRAHPAFADIAAPPHPRECVSRPEVLLPRLPD